MFKNFRLVVSRTSNKMQ